MSKFIQLSSDGQRMAFNVESIEVVSALNDATTPANMPANMPGTIHAALKLHGTNQIYFVDQTFDEIVEKIYV